MPGQQHLQQQQGGMAGMPSMEQQQRQGSLMSSLSAAGSMGGPQQQQQQYSLPLGVMPGQAGVPGPRPPPGEGRVALEYCRGSELQEECSRQQQ